MLGPPQIDEVFSHIMPLHDERKQGGSNVDGADEDAPVLVGGKRGGRL